MFKKSTLFSINKISNDYYLIFNNNTEVIKGKTYNYVYQN